MAFVLALKLLFQTDVLISTLLSNPPVASITRPGRKAIVCLESCVSSQLTVLEGTAAGQSELSSELAHEADTDLDLDSVLLRPCNTRSWFNIGHKNAATNGTFILSRLHCGTVLLIFLTCGLDFAGISLRRVTVENIMTARSTCGWFEY